MTDLQPYREPVDSWVEVVAPVAKLADAGHRYIGKGQGPRPPRVSA